MTLGENFAARGAATVADFGQAQHLDGPGAIGQPANEIALFQRQDQPVDARFGAQIERLLHFVERRRHARFLQALVNEAQQFALFSGQHLDASWRPPRRISARAPFTGTVAAANKQIMNEA